MQVILTSSTHLMQLDQPGIVVAAIREVIAAINENRSVTA